MNLAKKKALAAKVLGVGKERIVFLNSGLNDIKEAITKQDIRDLRNSGAISIREIKGRRKAKKGSRRVGFGSIRKKVNVRKKTYMTLTRKLRRHLAYKMEKGKMSKKGYKDVRNKIKNRFFKDRAHLKEHFKEAGK